MRKTRVYSISGPMIEFYDDYFGDDNEEDDDTIHMIMHGEVYRYSLSSLEKAVKRMKGWKKDKRDPFLKKH